VSDEAWQRLADRFFTAYGVATRAVVEEGLPLPLRGDRLLSAMMTALSGETARVILSFDPTLSAGELAGWFRRQADPEHCRALIEKVRPS
jgi:hypothetical protein